MGHQSQIIGVELVIGISYLLILIGFALRNVLEGGRARLLWPWLLVSIFGLCGLTRLEYVGFVAAPDTLEIVLHLSLAASALAYGVGQLLYACWPELFEEDGALPLLVEGDAADEVHSEIGTMPVNLAGDVKS